MRCAGHSAPNEVGHPHRVVRGVLFDLFGTLVPRPDPMLVGTNHRDIADMLNIQEGAYLRVWESSAFQLALLTGAFRTITMALSALARQCRKRPSMRSLASSENCYLRQLSHFVTPRSYATDLVRAIARQQVRLGLVSDCGPGVPALWHRLPLSSHFVVSVFSVEHGQRKPSVSLLRSACERLQLPPEECLVVGDDMCRDLCVAGSLGMRTCLLDAAYHSYSCVCQQHHRSHAVAHSLQAVLPMVCRAHIVGPQDAPSSLQRGATRHRRRGCIQ